MDTIRTYTELTKLETLEERFEYLKLGGQVGIETFGVDRWINQAFYKSREWRHIREHIIARDMGLDLGVVDNKIRGAHAIHHMNPITVKDIEESTEYLLDPEYLIMTGLRTHNAIHYGDATQIPKPWTPRRPGDTVLW